MSDRAVGVDLAFHTSALPVAPEGDALAPVLGRLRELGYRRAVLPPLDPAGTDAASLRTAFERADLAPIAMVGLAPGQDVSSDDDDERAAGRAALLAAVDLAVALGADQLNGVPYGLFGKPATAPGAAAFERSALVVGEVADRAADRGVQLTFEVLNRYEEGLVNTAAQAVEYVAASGSAHLGVHLDTFHMAVEEADLAAAVRTALPHLRYLELGQSGRGDLGSGAVDVAGVLRSALAGGYTGRVGVEAFSRALMPGAVADALAIWRSPYDDGLGLAERALALVQHAASGTPAPHPAVPTQQEARR
ncbi:D-psicose/D-tagatose/L-ribulose 3-epimerase [Quadrisphaera granulorum]|uniref:D-psicose/D-tagatose/L-ribulose 3-epimerase n=1 Tax=Quadrisphaera granulorum TaxID=317664 RepID=A0A316AA45_9ACTN|nr:sugar phosphate isomerase/epimerase family protein [Quadrisphaera granulorum]PWJ54402.1 D-psicose/D-tagatose/L-ribulose 3-epimerase [Quadrisphaera granulorum]SZE96174.1 D-psicose/D-tagatose/L-ribulose 3-epimerase [Quadrisphaera granulorum]